ncbi:fatty acid oxidation complex subunit alpha FadB [Paraburkholderia bannensis]|uniref:fatty acid oxidation complex subunit alpha FadB n=1 Tax=Paraburkholderia bannensis TaxID=765414 RepID=UPI002AC33164|nr:fatty acid oxidation complex subunit alpha FadB [Paraburkholderia bannensis]
MFAGDSIEVKPIGDGLVELCFHRPGESINKLDQRTIDEFREASVMLARDESVRGVLVTSSKEVFIVGADIGEFSALFRRPAETIAAHVRRNNDVLAAFEDLGVPTVAAINGFALGGGLELALACSLRAMSTQARVGLPEVSLGLFPGLGGTVRMARVAGPRVAVEWIRSGKPSGAEQAQEAGVVDVVAEPDALREAALDLLRRAASGEIDWRAAQQRKRDAIDAAALDALDAALAQVSAKASAHQPAALCAAQTMREGATLVRDAALDLEARAFADVAKTQAAGALVQTFMSQQALKKTFRAYAQQARPVTQAAVLGAGIMGGGIAYASALRGTPLRLKDIAQAQLDLGMSEAQRQLARQVKAGRLAHDKADGVLASITPQLDYRGFDHADLVIEAVVENLDVKRRVLAELEQQVRADTVIASNTSSLRIDDIAVPLARPENFVGMHFFNPVPVMPLVEVIRGQRTSEAAVASAVGFAVSMGKTPIVVKDCPGFLVNRILTPYINAFVDMVAEGVDFERIDRAMEGFGWPMGPAWLQDVVGMDVGSHVVDVISAGYPERMRPDDRSALRLMVAHGRFGQKSGAGFYRYEKDESGKLRKLIAPEAHALLAQRRPASTVMMADAEIVERMMLPMIAEAVRALAEGVVATAAELDTALLLGLGFPAHVGGALKYADRLGLDALLGRFECYASLGEAYRAPALLRDMAAAKQLFYPA